MLSVTRKGGKELSRAGAGASADHHGVALVAGLLIGVFQLVGRTQAGNLFSAVEGSAFGELRLWVMVALSVWLLVTSAASGSRFQRFRLGEVRASGWVIVLFVMYMIATTLWAPDLVLAQRKAYDLLFVGWSAVLTVVSVGLFGYRATMEGFWFSLFSLGLVLAGAGLIAASSSGYEGRLTAFGGGPNVYGRNMGLLAIASVRLVVDDRRWVRRLAALVTPISALLVMLSGSRGAMLALFVGTIAYLGTRKWDRRVVRLMLMVVAIGLVVVATQFGRLAVLMFQQRFIVSLLMEGYFTNRDTLLLDGVMAGLRYPVGGLGLAGFVKLGSEGAYPHNMFVEAFAEGGSIGLVLLCIPFMVYLRRWRNGMGTGDSFIFAALMLLLVSSSISGDLFDARGVFLLLLVALASQTRNELPAGDRSERELDDLMKRPDLASRDSIAVVKLSERA